MPTPKNEELTRAPPWARKLNTRTMNVVINAFAYDVRSSVNGGYASYSCAWVTPDNVREKGEEWFLNQPNSGPKTVAEIGAAIGGWNEENNEEIRARLLTPSPSMVDAGAEVLYNSGTVPSQKTSELAISVWKAMVSAKQ